MKYSYFKYFEAQPPAGDPPFHLRGVGVLEEMRPCTVRRPQGTGDWLFMYFYDPVELMIDGAVSEYPPGTLMIWTDKDGHHYGNEHKNWLHTWLHCQGPLVSRLLKEQKLSPGSPLSLSSPEIIESYASLMHREITGHRPPDGLILRNLYHSLLREIARDISREKSFVVPERISRVLRHIESHYDERLCLRELAGMACVSVPRFCTEFKRCLGSSPIDYLIEVRMRQAQYLLSDEGASVREVGARVGYDDPFQFSKMFKKKFGMSPRAARRKP
ncbi:MAG: hypothetical protein A2X49_11840 [Lentisphaerae bacterium GWF2_52_8]|nr:MAG: hypothetical protein A2X49_11840 [Lentisphaerae bacterium GWF2_52_8]